MKKLLMSALILLAFATMCFSSGYLEDGREHGAQDPKPVINYDIYVGQYEVAKDFVLTITNENGKLMGEPGGEKVEFKPEGRPDEFFSSAVNARLRFAKDKEGAIIAVVVTIEGKDYYSKKIK